MKPYFPWTAGFLKVKKDFVLAQKMSLLFRKLNSMLSLHQILSLLN